VGGQVCSDQSDVTAKTLQGDENKHVRKDNVKKAIRKGEFP